MLPSSDAWPLLFAEIVKLRLQHDLSRGSISDSWYLCIHGRTHRDCIILNSTTKCIQVFWQFYFLPKCQILPETGSSFILTENSLMAKISCVNRTTPNCHRSPLKVVYWIGKRGHSQYSSCRWPVGHVITVGTSSRRTFKLWTDWPHDVPCTTTEPRSQAKRWQ